MRKAFVILTHVVVLASIFPGSLLALEMLTDSEVEKKTFDNFQGFNLGFGLGVVGIQEQSGDPNGKVLC